ncbi:Ethanolamine utilization protein [Anopheles sinensis]|uniref:Ethanolamine utilization protein n=1 Tax=Anopheles sinensis TaxID=74873 RepID=A0A084W0X0_ANOSI|nr:Ethanolamine utilization protein [Anopheles sinensis]
MPAVTQKTTSPPKAFRNSHPYPPCSGQFTDDRILVRENEDDRDDTLATAYISPWPCSTSIRRRAEVCV